MDELHRLSAILIERETIDKDQFLRLLEGASEEEVFAEEPPVTAPEAEQPKERRPAPKPKPFPVPGAMMQPPPPDPAKS
jgi:cell division protease FtsH